MKHLIFVIIMISFLSSFFKSYGQNKKTDYPLEKFSVVDAKLSNGKPVVGSINMAYKEFVYKSKYPWCLTINIGLDLKNVDHNGLPTKAESDILNRFEDVLLNTIKSKITFHYIGHLYNDSFLDIYGYLDNPEPVNDFLQKEVNKKGLIRGFAFEIKKDPRWSVVDKFLK